MEISEAYEPAEEGLINKDEQYFLPKLLRYCLYRERSEHETRLKLDEWECPEELAERLMEQVILERYVDNSRFAYHFAHGKYTLKRWGRVKIRYALKTIHKLPAGLIDYAMRQAIDPDDYFTTLLKLAEKKWTAEKRKKGNETKGKIANYLYSKGYEWDLIYEAVGQMMGLG